MNHLARVMRNILIVEDHDGCRAWWKKHLGDVFPGAPVSSAATLADARELLVQHCFTLVILDINLPDGSGIDLLREITLSYPETYGVICSIYDDDKHIFASLRAGAKGYLLKDQSREQQLDQLADIVRGRPPLSPGVARRILGYFSEGKEGLCETGEHAIRLSSRETEVLTMLAKGYSRPEVAELLGITLNTVSGYTKAIYQKLNISNRAEAVVEAVKLGLIDRDIE